MRRTLGFAAVVAVYVVWNAAVARAEDFTGKVTSVSSAHIVQVEHDGKRELVVLNGVTSPNSKTPEGKQAKAFVANRALDQEVKVEVVRRSDRIVTGTVFLPDGTDLAQLVLSEGMGSWNRLTAPDNTRYRDLEAGAKMQNLGLWGLERPAAATIPPAAPAKPAARVEPNKAGARAEPQQPADGKKPKLVLRGDADVAEAAHAQFEKEQQTTEEERARQAAEQEKQIIAQQKRDEAAANQEAVRQQGVSNDMPSQGGVPPQ
ncbi:MAG: thermonuclease family protein [Candidatus Hydrogenedentes bacterium]|nr:thermonuclease family protein [Candidatus Hydrogenedentota bacterium]